MDFDNLFDKSELPEALADKHLSLSKEESKSIYKYMQEHKPEVM